MPSRAMPCSAAIIALVALASPALAQTAPVFDRGHAGVWSATAQYLWPGPTAIADFPLGGRDIVVPSPDGSILARATNIELTLVDRNNPMRFARTSLPIASLTEILWAPDSTAFALTQSDGGWIGAWSVLLYHLRSDGIIASNPGAPALADFNRRFSRCPEEYPNVAAIGWVDGSRRLRLVVEMPCHSSCSDMCKVAGYVVDPARGTIIEHLPDTAVRSRWKAALGSRFRRK